MSRGPNRASSPGPEQPPDAGSQPRDIRARALDLLARREHSRTELADKLTRRGFEPAPVAVELDRLEADGLLSNVRFAQAYVASRSARGFGPLRIGEELRQRGIEGPVREEACPRDDRHWSALATAARIKRFGAPLPATFAERARQSRFLAQRGFSRTQIAAAVGGDPGED